MTLNMKRMNLHTIHRMAAALALAAIVLFAAPPEISARTAKHGKLLKKTQIPANTFDTPDFSFPETVIANAETKLTPEASDADAVLAMTQLAIARMSVSRDAAPQVMAQIDSLASARGGVAAALLYTLEARMLVDIKNNNWSSGSRTLPLSDPFPENPEEWSADMFRLRVLELSRKALAQPQLLKSVPAGAWKPVFTQLTDSQLLVCPDMYAFVAMQSVEVLRSIAGNPDAAIPFFGNDAGYQSPAQQAVSYAGSLADSLVSHADAIGSAALLAEAIGLRNYESPAEKYKAYIDAFNRFSSSPQASALLIDAASLLQRGGFDYDSDAGGDGMVGCGAYGQFEDLITEYISGVPDAMRINNLKNVLTDLRASHLRVKTSDKVHSGKPVEVTVAGLREGTDRYLKLFRIKSSSDNRSLLDKVLDKGASEPLQTLPLRGASTPCSTDTIHLSFSPQPYGRYALVLATEGGVNRRGITNMSDVLQFAVTDLAVIKVIPSDKEADGKKGRLYVVDNMSGQPVKDASVTFVNKRYGSAKTKTEYGRTDADGAVKVPYDSKYSGWEVNVSKGADKLSTSLYSRINRENTESKASIYTDLAVYHPGDTVRYAVICYSTGPDGSRVLAEKKISVTVSSPSGDIVDERKLVSDAYGRVEGEFVTSTTGMNGSYSIDVETDDESGANLAFRDVEVADYVVPKFFVDVRTSAKAYKPGDVVKVEGKVQTFSGMSVADAEVRLKVDFRRMFRYWGGSVSDSFAATLKADAEGNFSMDLPTDSLPDKYTQGFFIVTASATSQAGETQTSTPVEFTLGARSSVSIFDTPDKIRIENDSITLKARVSNIDGTPLVTPLDYTLMDEDTGKCVLEGSFESPTLTIASAALPSGRYKWTVRLPGDEDGKDEKVIVIYRPDDECPPAQTDLWVPVEDVTAADDQRTVGVTVGSSRPDSRILCIVSGKTGILQSLWIVADSCNVTVDVPAPEVNDCVFVRFVTLRDGIVSSASVVVKNAEQERKPEAEVVTFRDRITAGDKETWSFRYRLGDSPAAFIPVIAAMTDKALDMIVRSEWRMPSLFTYSPNVSADVSGIYPMTDRWTVAGKYLKYDREIAFPMLNTYGMSFGSYAYMINSTRLYGASAPRMASPQKKMKAEEEVMAVSADCVLEDVVSSCSGGVYDSKTTLTGSVAEESAEEEDGGGVAEDDSRGNYRAAECPLSFFRPMLKTDAEGMLTLSFTVPDYNTTWKLRLLAYTPEVKSVLTQYESVASKKVMVQSQLPRFLRTGDRCVLAFTTFNNSGAEADIMVHATVFDPLTGRVLTERSFAPRRVADAASFVETLELTAPSDLGTVGVRVVATLGRHSDGEQSLIGILPSSTPVTESWPFFMAPADTQLTIDVPASGREGAQTMFSYCDNPVWYCVTALPDMTFPTDASILSTVRHLYGNTIAAGIVSRYPAVRGAIEAWSADGDSTLISPLQRDNVMKIMELDDTPWTLNAQGETLRMSRLTRLLDTAGNEAAINAALEELQRRQLPSGGWSWCEGMRPSTFITGRVLLYFSMLRRMGFMPQSSPADAMIEKAVRYVDDELYTDYVKSKKHFSTTAMMNYLYVRSGLGDIKMSDGFARLTATALNSVRTSWRTFGIYDASVAAILLNRKGYPMEARTILESLTQKAMKSTERGMWYDNLNSGWNGRNKLITTMQALEAFAEVSPQSPSVDMLRQWLLIQRQTEDWGNADEIAEVVYAILTSGTDWTADYTPASFMLDGQPLTVAKRDALTGSFTISLESPEGARLTVTKSADHQAWGGVLSRSVRPIAEVKPFSESDIKITKRLLLVTEDATGVHTSEVKDGQHLAKGDKVRVELTIISQRDMDYVCVMDGRAACLSPTEQLSGFVWQDGTGYYRDVHNDYTNLFFDFLRKGVTITGYDCHVSQNGEYSAGIAQTQCLYAPLQTAHSGGSVIRVAD